MVSISESRRPFQHFIIGWWPSSVVFLMTDQFRSPLNRSNENEVERTLKIISRYLMWKRNLRFRFSERQLALNLLRFTCEKKTKIIFLTVIIKLFSSINLFYGSIKTNFDQFSTFRSVKHRHEDWSCVGNISCSL